MKSLTKKERKEAYQFVLKTIETNVKIGDTRFCICPALHSWVSNFKNHILMAQKNYISYSYLEELLKD